MRHTCLRGLSGVALLAASCVLPVWSQEWSPTKPIKIVVPIVGSTNDAIARLVLDAVEEGRSLARIELGERRSCSPLRGGNAAKRRTDGRQIARERRFLITSGVAVEDARLLARAAAATTSFLRRRTVALVSALLRFNGLRVWRLRRRSSLGGRCRLLLSIRLRLIIAAGAGRSKAGAAASLLENLLQVELLLMQFLVEALLLLQILQPLPLIGELIAALEGFNEILDLLAETAPRHRLPHR